MMTDTLPTPIDAAELKRGKAAMLAAVKYLMREEPFFATLLLGLERIAVGGDATMATNGKYIKWGIDFVNKASRAKVTFVTLHEVMHIVLKHNLRRGNRDPYLWNNAGDYVINGLLTVMGMGPQYASMTLDQLRDLPRESFAQLAKSPEYVMPEDGLFEPKFLGLDTFQVYDLLISEQKNEEGPPPPPGDGPPQDCPPGDGPPGESDQPPQEGEGDQPGEEGERGKGKCPWGHVEDLTDEEGGGLSADDLREAEKIIDRVILTAENIAKGRGKMPGVVSDAVDTLNRPSQDWRDVLREFLADTLPTDYSFAKPNRFHLGSDIVMPTTEAEGLGHIGIYADASGSVNRDEWQQFMSDVYDIFDELEPERLTMIQFDSRAGEPQDFERGEEIDLTRHRGGGTTFRVAFDKADEHGLDDEFDAVIVLTDGGDNTYPEVEPSYPVIWATTGAFWGGDPPWGEMVQVKFGD